MAEEQGEADLPPWLSITGQPLQLSLHSGFQGACLSDKCELLLMIVNEGQCVPVDSYEKLNQLGEGSQYNALCQYACTAHHVQRMVSFTAPSTVSPPR